MVLLPVKFPSKTESFFSTIQRLLTERLLHARHCCRCGRCSSEDKVMVL